MATTRFDYAFPAVDSIVVNQIASNQLASDNISRIQSNIVTNVNNELIGNLNNADASSQNSLAYGFMSARNTTIDTIANDLKSKNDKITSSGAKQTYARQGQINEWQAQNKLDTLFFLQLVFLYLCLIIVCIFLKEYGLMSNSTLWMIIGIFGLVLIGVLWNRSSYTIVSRDKKYWNRRYVGIDDGVNLSAKLKCEMNKA